MIIAYRTKAKTVTKPKVPPKLEPYLKSIDDN